MSLINCIVLAFVFAECSPIMVFICNFSSALRLAVALEYFHSTSELCRNVRQSNTHRGCFRTKIELQIHF